MRIHSLEVENIGPFDHAKLEFIPSDEPAVSGPVALITGENGTGKSIVIDAIRAMFGNQFAVIERRITRPSGDFRVALSLVDQLSETLVSTHSDAKNGFELHIGSPLRSVPSRVKGNRSECPKWIVDFWRSSLATDSFDIESLKSQRVETFLQGSLQGTYRNAAVTELLCSFDYLRDSRESTEKRIGEVLYETASKIIRASLLDGELSHVERSTFTPMVRQAGQLVPIANISSGNAYLVHHLIGVLGKMFAIQQLLSLEPEDLTKTPGLVLIEEPENHLHPRWQKRVLRDILEIFPNLQIIATTHSPFILSSIPQAKVFACRFDGTSCVVDDVTTDYAARTAEEILLSEAFDATTPFGLEMTELLTKRKAAMESGDAAARASIEAELKRRNPEHFAYLDIDAKLAALAVKKSA